MCSSRSCLDLRFLAVGGWGTTDCEVESCGEGGRPRQACRLHTKPALILALSLAALVVALVSALNQTFRPTIEALISC